MGDKVNTDQQADCKMTWGQHPDAASHINPTDNAIAKLP